MQPWLPEQAIRTHVSFVEHSKCLLSRNAYQSVAKARLVGRVSGIVKHPSLAIVDVSYAGSFRDFNPSGNDRHTHWQSFTLLVFPLGCIGLLIHFFKVRCVERQAGKGDILDHYITL